MWIASTPTTATITTILHAAPTTTPRNVLLLAAANVFLLQHAAVLLHATPFTVPDAAVLLDATPFTVLAHAAVLLDATPFNAPAHTVALGAMAITPATRIVAHFNPAARIGATSTREEPHTDAGAARNLTDGTTTVIRVTTNVIRVPGIARRTTTVIGVPSSARRTTTASVRVAPTGSVRRTSVH
jgi:hypothetical protein